MRISTKFWVGMFQSTRPRGARPDPPGSPPAFPGVSIHAPARGATRTGTCATSSSCSFNPRAREGRDVLGHALTRPRFVSIHAPARGATRSHSLSLALSVSFNPRAREGRDQCNKRCNEALSGFQSTRPRGARPLILGAIVWVGKFQSTRPRGARLLTRPLLI